MYSVMAAGGEQEENYSASLGSEDLSEIICDPCHEDGEIHKAVGMCADCQDHLCQRCFDVHTVPRPFKKHKLLDKQQMLQSQMSLKRKDQCTERCSIHEDEIIKFFCLHHSLLGCGVCISLDHRLCDSVTYIQHATHDLTNKEEYRQAESQLKSVVKKSRKLAESYKQKSESLEKYCKESVKSIQEFRKKLNNLLDNIEGDLIKSCETLKSEEIKKMTQIVDSCKTAQADLCALKTRIETYKNNKQNCNLYTLMMKTKGTLKYIEEKFKEAENGQTSINSQITFVANKATLDMLKPPRVFGKLTVSSASAVIGHTEQTEQTTAVKKEETVTVLKAEYVQDIKVRSKSDSNTCFISGMVLLSDSRLFIADFNNGTIGNGNVKLIDIKHDNKAITHLVLSSPPVDVAKINNSQVVVTLPRSEKVASVSVTNSAMTVDSMLDVNGECSGVDYKDGKLAVSFRNPFKVQVLTLQGRILHTITTDTKGHPVFINTNSVIFGQDTTSLFVSNWGCNDVVVHVKLDGTVVDTYTVKKLRGPQGLLTDNSGNVYVCGVDSNNIHQITPDFKKKRVLLTSADGLSAPLCISYSEAESMLFVGMYRNDVVQMYKVTLGVK